MPDGDVAIVVVDAPTRRDLALACAQPFRYPADLLLRGDWASVAEYLDARYRRRLMAAYGDPAGLRATPGTS